MIIEPNGREIAAIELLACLDAQLATNSKHLEGRLKTIGGGAWRDYRCAAAMVQKTIDRVYETLPPRTIKHMKFLVDNGQVVIRQKPLIDDNVQIVPNHLMRFMVDEVIKARCIGCFERGASVKGCKVRKTLSLIAPSTIIPTDGTCPYQHVVADNEFGEYM